MSGLVLSGLALQKQKLSGLPWFIVGFVSNFLSALKFLVSSPYTASECTGIIINRTQYVLVGFDVISF